MTGVQVKKWIVLFVQSRKEVKEMTDLKLLKKATHYILKKNLQSEFWNWCHNSVTNDKIINFYKMKVGV